MKLGEVLVITVDLAVHCMTFPTTLRVSWYTQSDAGDHRISYIHTTLFF